MTTFLTTAELALQEQARAFVDELIPWEVATLKIDFICATPDFFVTGCGVCGCLVCLALNKCCARR